MARSTWPADRTAFPLGATIVLREVLGGRVRSARPLRVVAHTADVFAGYLLPDSQVAWPRLADGSQSQTPDQGWLLANERWFGPGALFVLSPGTAYAAVLFFDRESGEPTGWKVDFLRPPRPTAVGFDTLDYAFDLLADLAATEVVDKDADDLAQLRRLGQLDPSEFATLERAVTEARAALRGGRAPFAPPWTMWRPDRHWRPLTLPAGWDDLPARPSTPAGPAVVGAGLRSAQGLRGVDGDGRLVFDLDLAARALLHGHAHPAIVAALTRQAPLGWSLFADHPAVAALEAALLAPLPAGSSMLWAPTVAAAQALVASLTAATGDLAASCVDLTAGLAHGWPPSSWTATAGGGPSSPPRGPVLFGPSLFGGLGGAAVVLPPHWPVPDPALLAPEPPNALAALAALETLRLLSPAAVRATREAADRLRALTGLGGNGAYLSAPQAAVGPLRRAGVLIGADGAGLLATVATSDDVDAIAARVAPVLGSG